MSLSLSFSTLFHLITIWTSFRLVCISINFVCIFYLKRRHVLYFTM